MKEERNVEREADTAGYSLQEEWERGKEKKKQLAV